MKRAVVFLLFLALVAAAAFVYAGRRPQDRRNLEFFPDMAYSPAWIAYSANPDGPHGAAMRLPPEGVIPFGMEPFDYAPGPAGALAAAAGLHSPIPTPAPEAAVARGRAVYAKACALCHGPGGLGDGLVPKRGFPPPPSLLADKARNLPDGQVYHIITRGQGNMPPHAIQVTREDRWNVIAYLRTLQAAAPAAAPAGTPVTAPAAPVAPADGAASATGVAPAGTAAPLPAVAAPAAPGGAP